MTEPPAARPLMRPDAALVRALTRASGWVVFVAVASLVVNGFGILALLRQVPELGELPLFAARALRWLTLFAIFLYLAPIGTAIVQLRYGLAARRLGEHPSTLAVEEVLDRLALYWTWSAVVILGSVILAMLLVFVGAAAVAAAS